MSQDTLPEYETQEVLSLFDMINAFIARLQQIMKFDVCIVSEQNANLALTGFYRKIEKNKNNIVHNSGS